MRDKIAEGVLMARWRKEAIDRLPELRETIASAHSVMSLWIELTSVFEWAYRQDPPPESLIGRIYSFADWCYAAPRQHDAENDPLSAVTAGFHEDIPTIRAAREDMPRWFSYEAVAGNPDVFSYLIGDKAYAELVTYMKKNQHKYKRRDS